MKTTLKVFGIINIVLGSLAVVEGFGSDDWTMLTGGLWWIANGIIFISASKKIIDQQK